MSRITRTEDRGGPTIYQIKVNLRHTHPPIWRRIQMPADIALDELHAALQIAMGWKDAHLHLFIVNGAEYGVTDPEFGTTIRDEREAVLGELVQEGDRLIYVYDFGDEWEHELLIEKALPAEAAARLPCCIAGARACPPEDSGGPPGYAQLLAALASPDAPERAELLDWLGGDFDPEAFDLEAANEALRSI